MSSKTVSSPRATRPAILDLLTKICETPSPTFAEGTRAKLVSQLFNNMGLHPKQDEVGNVTVELAGGSGPRVLVAAHLDTVFDIDTNVTVKQSGDKLTAPGIGDNSASLAVMLHYAQQVLRDDDLLYPQLTLAATVGEEGLGDLYGIRHLMETRAQDFDMMIALDGHLGTIVNKAVGSKRFEITLRARGGHSWGDYPSPSAVHALGDAIYSLTRMSIPRNPRSSFNIGQVSGGTSINAIAQKAMFNLDLRSIDAPTLAGLEHDALNRIKRAAKRHLVSYDIKQVGHRPTANVKNAVLVRAAQDALETINVKHRTAASSTDANAAMAAGLPAISFGVYRGGDAHRLSEWLDPDSLELGFEAFTQLMKLLAQ